MDKYEQKRREGCSQLQRNVCIDLTRVYFVIKQVLMKKGKESEIILDISNEVTWKTWKKETRDKDMTEMERGCDISIKGTTWQNSRCLVFEWSH